MTYGYNSYNNNPPLCFLMFGIVVIIGVLVGLGVLVNQAAENQRVRNTPPAAATVATVSTGVGNVEASGRYTVETIQTSPFLSEAQASLVTWIASHPDQRIVDVIPMGDEAHGQQTGFIIIAEARTP